MSFASLFARYNDWLSQAVRPAVTMIESSPMAQIPTAMITSRRPRCRPRPWSSRGTYYPTCGSGWR